MGFVKNFGEKYNWSRKRIMLIESVLDILLWLMIITMFYFGMNQIMFMNECKDVIQCQCPFGEIVEGENTSRYVYLPCPNFSINATTYYLSEYADL